MENSPKASIEFLVDFELEFMNYSEINSQSNLETLNNDSGFNGKKGLHLCGGNVDNVTNEISGCLLDGTYTFYANNSKSYLGFLGDCLSANDYTFSVPQQITFKSKNTKTYLKSVLIYFDSIAGEYPTELYFTNAINEDGTIDNRYTSAFKIKNNKLLFMFSFGENSQIKQITLNISKWNKKNSLVKIIKIKTGYTGIYDYKSLMSLKWDDDKFSDESELKFGISSNAGTLEIVDNKKIIYGLYSNNLIFQNVKAKFYIDDIQQGEFYIDTKNNERGSDIWTFECIDFFERIKDDIVPIMQIDNSGTCSIKKIISWVTERKGISVEYSPEALVACENYLIPKAYIKSQQTVYGVLLKCCQVCLLRMYVSLGKLKITRGI